MVVSTHCGILVALWAALVLGACTIGTGEVGGASAPADPLPWWPDDVPRPELVVISSGVDESLPDAVSFSVFGTPTHDSEASDAFRAYSEQLEQAGFVRFEVGEPSPDRPAYFFDQFSRPSDVTLRDGAPLHDTVFVDVYDYPDAPAHIQVEAVLFTIDDPSRGAPSLPVPEPLEPPAAPDDPEPSDGRT